MRAATPTIDNRYHMAISVSLKGKRAFLNLMPGNVARFTSCEKSHPPIPAGARAFLLVSRCNSDGRAVGLLQLAPQRGLTHRIHGGRCSDRLTWAGAKKQ